MSFCRSPSRQRCLLMHLRCYWHKPGKEVIKPRYTYFVDAECETGNGWKWLENYQTQMGKALATWKKIRRRTPWDGYSERSMKVRAASRKWHAMIIAKEKAKGGG
ncbi:hypothetical protein Pmar_PMAR025545 [Perkinsus marinus ATCC 50983]|uniref:Uncharacterized protein n=1 Tax=Perkinsus marinus (strain ATCC 50983 / TXsc) TaxID=423536 RepID=C5LZC7_PERM5|nr:hypothetical protein Pmar_PMAR025545 [Perkinsus marinus ATCC 50983]EEQ97921.1 hypothetical protein Pmar_PMAR025545 [Perkinsus marinus ATCC 50983]|eukprot:XP_002765204.1 hypothetical protein Pmar_PMAR025545 [Perkinsus marinus ATCC 50983]